MPINITTQTDERSPLQSPRCITPSMPIKKLKHYQMCSPTPSNSPVDVVAREALLRMTDDCMPKPLVKMKR